MSQKRQDIQGLRGWAIVLVALFHFFPAYFPNGYVGVDMFFVISGYLMAMILARSKAMNLATFQTFYYRRIARILPLYYLVIFAILLMVLFVLPLSFRSANIVSSRGAIFLRLNIREDDINKNYVEMLQEAEDLLTHTWSLCVEMQWYLLVPIIILIQRLITVHERIFFLGVACSSIIFYFLADYDTAFYNVFARIWQFSCGIIAFAPHMNSSSFAKPSKGEQAPVGNPVDVESKAEVGSGRFGVPSLNELTTYCFFLLSVAVPFLWIPLPSRYLRVETTITTAVLVFLGDNYKILFTAQQAIVYVGELSYAFYLIHWPVYVIINHYYFENPLGPFFGIFVSALVAVIIHHYYEVFYLKWSPTVIITVLVSLVAASTYLSSQPEKLAVVEFGEGPVDYSKINENEGAWNMTLMRYLLAKESKAGSHLFHKECRYSNRFVNRDIKPTGFCSMKDGNGKYDFLVIGNSFACNQGDLVYEAFKNHARQFNIFCLPGCEMLTPTSRAFCLIDFNYTSVVEELNPDIVFVINRAMTAVTPFLTTRSITKDKIFKYQMDALDVLEKMVKKVYIIQALPWCVRSCTDKALAYTDHGKPLNTIEEQLINRNQFFARQRIWELGRRYVFFTTVHVSPVKNMSCENSYSTLQMQKNAKLSTTCQHSLIAEVTT